MKPITNGVAGSSWTCSGVPICSSRHPCRMVDPVGEFQGLILIVSDEDGRLAGLLVNFTQPSSKILAHLRVEGAEGLIQQEHPGLDRKRSCQRNALALAAGQLGRIRAPRSSS